MLEENKAIVRRNFEEIWNKENFSVADETHASDYVAHIASSPEDIKGIQQFKQFVALFHFAFPDTQFTIEDQIAEGSKVATRWTARGM
jgi:predicted ester cyclase